MRLSTIAGARIRANASFVATSLGPLGWIGVGTLLLASGLLAIVLPSISRHNEQQARELDALELQREQLRNPKVAQAQRDPVLSLVSNLPPASAVPDFLASLQRRADNGAVQIDRTEYHAQSLIDNAAQRYRLSFPAHVDYPHLRTWLEALLHDYPSLALLELSMRREVDGGEELDAHVGLSFLAREPL